MWLHVIFLPLLYKKSLALARFFFLLRLLMFVVSPFNELSHKTHNKIAFGSL